MIRLSEKLSDETIDQHLAGKTVKHVWANGDRLSIETQCGHWINIVWKDDRPRLHSVDVRIVLEQVGPLFGEKGCLNLGLK
jgi:hypothetical protein